MSGNAELRARAVAALAAEAARDASHSTEDAYDAACDAEWAAYVWLVDVATPARILALLDAHDAMSKALRDATERHIAIVERVCDEIMSRTETPIKRAKEDAWLSEQCHQEGRWHGANDCQKDIIAAIRAEVQS